MAEKAPISVKARAKVNTVNDYGASPMAEAAVIGNVAVLEKLLKAGADPEATNAQGQTALMVIARTRNVDAARLLVVGTFRDTGDEITDPLAALLADLRRVPSVSRMKVAALDRAAVERFVADAVGHRLDAPLRSLAATLAAAAHLFARQGHDAPIEVKTSQKGQLLRLTHEDGRYMVGLAAQPVAARGLAVRQWRAPDRSASAGAAGCRSRARRPCDQPAPPPRRTARNRARRWARRRSSTPR